MHPQREKMYLIIDIGNTLHKVAVFSQEGKLVESRKFRQLTKSRLNQLFAQYDISYAILSSVGKYRADIETCIGEYCPLLLLSSATPLPVTIQYETPESLGPDRIANAVGAHSLYPQQNVLSFQLGTCLVCDFVNDRGEYCGGSIAPGIDMRFKALRHYTRKLPLVRKNVPKQVVGANTEQSILSGVINGVVFEIEGMIAAYQKENKNLKVVVAGGDADLLQKSIKFPIFAAPNIVLWGLFEILRYNVEK